MFSKLIDLLEASDSLKTICDALRSNVALSIGIFELIKSFASTRIRGKRSIFRKINKLVIATSSGIIIVGLLHSTSYFFNMFRAESSDLVISNGLAFIGTFGFYGLISIIFKGFYITPLTYFISRV